MFKSFLTVGALALANVASAIPSPKPSSSTPPDGSYDVLILGGGVAGVIAAQQLYNAGITNFMIVEARDELGGRMRSTDFEGTTIELGCNWVEGTQKGNGLANPIWTLAKKHNISRVYNDWEDLTFYDQTGHHNFSDIYEEQGNYYDAMQVAAGVRVDLHQVDSNVRTGFRLVGAKFGNQYEKASEYYNFDWEYAQTPEQSSWLGTMMNYNFTFNADRGGFSEEDFLAIDQRGFKYLIQAEAAEFLKPEQTMLSSTVTNITYHDNGVSVTIAGGKVLQAKYSIVTFSVGVLQTNAVTWSPALPHWKVEAIMSMKMAAYTKIFLKFDEKFWDDTEMGLYADPNRRGYYPVWQSLDHPGFFEGSGLYFVTVTGDESERIETMTDDAVQAEVMAVLRSMYPNKTIPEPKAFIFYRWLSDPLFKGSFSNWPASFYLEHLDNLRDPVQNVFFAGEATSFRYYGYLQGAYSEGESVGQKVATCVKNNGCTSLQAPKGTDVPNRNKVFPPWYAPEQA
ncbi:hypothetical protein FRB93_010000 [Tulasnella sp. JGI-2019a]|nr:hypothetical protein FRB93_010000 [Tulasnella sp. JGI-2019a]